MKNKHISVAYWLVVQSYFLYDQWEYFTGRDDVSLIEIDKIIHGENYCHSKEFLCKAIRCTDSFFREYELEGIRLQDETFSENQIRHRAFNFFLSECYPDDGKKMKFCKTILGASGTGALIYASAALFFLSICYRDFPLFAEKISSRMILSTETIYRELEHMKTCILMGASAVLARVGKDNKLSIENSIKARKPRTRYGMTPEERQKRNDEIRRLFRESRLDQTSFSERHAAEYKLKPRQIRNILKSALGS